MSIPISITPALRTLALVGACRVTAVVDEAPRSLFRGELRAEGLAVPCEVRRVVQAFDRRYKVIEVKACEYRVEDLKI